MFKLEAFCGLQSDALLLQFGSRTAPRYALTDGPPRSWTRWLQRGLAARPGAKAVPPCWIAVSHVDDDYIAGLLDL
jgi:hypothetical protein